MAGAKLVDAPSSPPAISARGQTPLLQAAPQPLPSRPRLRLSYWYTGDVLRLELVLMTEERELVHRETVEVTPGSTLENVHALLLSVAATRALHTGRAVGRAVVPTANERPEPAAEPTAAEVVIANSQPDPTLTE